LVTPSNVITGLTSTPRVRQSLVMRICCCQHYEWIIPARVRVRGLAGDFMITVTGPGDITVEVVERVSWGKERVRLAPQGLDIVERTHREVERSLADGQRVYGLNTGMGYLADRDLQPQEQRVHQRNLLIGRAVGGPPYLPPAEARAVLLIRLSDFLSGHPGVSAALCRFLVDRLNDDFVPAIPRAGIGCAGEVIPLAHAFQTFVGVGKVLVDGPAAAAADRALDDCGVGPYEPAAKEGIALLAGAPGAVAVAVARRREALVLGRQLLASAAAAIDALRAPLDPYRPVVAELAADPLMAEVLTALAGLLAGSVQPRQESQAPVSFRVVPQVHVHLERTLARFDEDIRRGLAAVGDSPALVDGAFVTNGGFHALGPAAGMDSVAIALVHTAELAGQRLHRLLDRRFTGLPDQLTPAPGPHCGLVLVQKRAVGALSELRRLATPATVGLADTSLGQEDAMTFAFEASEKLRRVCALVRDVVACELLAARQAWSLRGGGVAAGLDEIAERLCALVPPVVEDRPLGEDIEQLVGLLARNEI
jgi:histidine ammonia-lyase